MNDNDSPILKPNGEKSNENVPCLICVQLETGISQEAFLAEFGAVRLWNDSKRHQQEAHEKKHHREVPSEQ
jgi:hypothetical protein